MKRSSYQNDLEQLQAKLEEDPGNVRCLLDLGFLFFDRAHIPDKALDYYHRALELQPGDPAILHWIALVHYFERVDFDKALEVLSEALSTDPNSPECLSLYASVLSEYPMTKVTDYLEYLERAVRAAPDWPSPHVQLAVAYAQLGRWKEAKRALARAETVYNPKPPPRNSSEAYFQQVVMGQTPVERQFMDDLADRIRRKDVPG